MRGYTVTIIFNNNTRVIYNHIRFVIFSEYHNNVLMINLYKLQNHIKKYITYHVYVQSSVHEYESLLYYFMACYRRYISFCSMNMKNKLNQQLITLMDNAAYMMVRISE